jgi:CheY-like chemotaxis protein
MQNAASAALTKPTLKDKRILVVDDNAINLDIAAETLLFAGATVDSAASGEEAIDFIARAKYDLVVLDLAMPGIDGLTVGHAIRSSSTNAGTAILIFTASDNADAQRAARELKAQGLVPKPVDVDELLRSVVKHA